MLPASPFGESDEVILPSQSKLFYFLLNTSGLVPSPVAYSFSFSLFHNAPINFSFVSVTIQVTILSTKPHITGSCCFIIFSDNPYFPYIPTWYEATATSWIVGSLVIWVCAVAFAVYRRNLYLRQPNLRPDRIFLLFDLLPSSNYLGLAFLPETLRILDQHKSVRPAFHFSRVHPLSTSFYHRMTAIVCCGAWPETLFAKMLSQVSRAPL